MQLIVPDILLDVCALSQGPLLLGLTVGLILWLFGWWTHRFWVVLVGTVVAGIYGLSESEAMGAPVLLTSILLALSAGVLSLALVRVVAFAASGIAGVAAAQALAPTLDQPVVCFLVSGLLGLALFRPVITALTSLVGSLLSFYTAIGILHLHGVLDANAYQERGTSSLNWLCGGAALAGFLIQLYLERRRNRKAKATEEEEE